MHDLARLGILLIAAQALMSAHSPQWYILPSTVILRSLMRTAVCWLLLWKVFVPGVRSYRRGDQ
jgi:hypothetical protein